MQYPLAVDLVVLKPPIVDLYNFTAVDSQPQKLEHWQTARKYLATL